MQRQHPLLSPLGLAATVIVLLALAASFAQSGGQMFSPGPLAAAHVDIDDCAACHQPLKSNQAALCMDCHTEIEEERVNEAGLHARLAAPENCLACHPDHKGENFDLTAGALEAFDHELTHFSLVHHVLDYESEPMDCTSCHTDEGFNADLMACLACHDAAAPIFMESHLVDFGQRCLDCHDGTDWMMDFDHASTGFLLQDEHARAACADCHRQQAFTETPTACSACHGEPNRHKGLFQTACEDCHSPAGWSPAQRNGQAFDHLSAAGFGLARHNVDFSGGAINCASCHGEGLDQFSESTCTDCHIEGQVEFMAQHTATFGSNCLSCHDGLGALANFDHSTVFLLDGAHEPLECTACHVDQRFIDISPDCASCHEEPTLHAGLFGLNCESCHSTTAWQPAALTQHSFPLDHGDEGVLACETCHLTSFVQYTCDRCHEPAEMVEEHNEEDIFNIAGRCIECHPTGLEDERED